MRATAIEIVRCTSRAAADSPVISCQRRIVRSTYAGSNSIPKHRRCARSADGSYVHYAIRSHLDRLYGIYVGLIRHKDKVWPGLHEAIIDQNLWDAVQEKLQEASNRSRSSYKPRERSTKKKPSSSLAGKFRDKTGSCRHSERAAERFSLKLSRE